MFSAKTLSSPISVTNHSFIVQLWLTFVTQIVQSFFLNQNPITGLEVLQSKQTLKILHVTFDLRVTFLFVLHSFQDYSTCIGMNQSVCGTKLGVPRENPT